MVCKDTPVSKLKVLHITYYASASVASVCDLTLLAFGAISLSIIPNLQPAQYLVVLGSLQSGLFGLIVEASTLALFILNLLKSLPNSKNLKKIATICAIVASAVMITAHSYVAFFHFQSHTQSTAGLTSEDDCLDSEVLSSLQIAYDLAVAAMDEGCKEDSVTDCECYSDGSCLDSLDLEVQLLALMESVSDCGGFCSSGLRLFSDGESSDVSCRESLEQAVLPVFIRTFALLIVATIALAVSITTSTAGIIAASSPPLLDSKDSTINLNDDSEPIPPPNSIRFPVLAGLDISSIGNQFMRSSESISQGLSLARDL